MSKSMDTICVHGKEHAVKDQNYAISYPIYQTASFNHLTPYFQNPLSLGADVVIHSGTKYLSGHNDTICGFLCSKDQKLAQHFRLISKTTGGTLAPFESWLCLRGLKTLALRMERHQSNALAVAEWLKKQDCVENVEIALIFSNYFKNIVDIPEKMCYKI